MELTVAAGSFASRAFAKRVATLAMPILQWVRPIQTILAKAASLPNLVLAGPTCPRRLAFKPSQQAIVLRVPSLTVQVDAGAQARLGVAPT